MKYIYVAGPLSTGGYGKFPEHFRAAIDAGEALIATGFIPFIPHLDHTWNLVSPHDYEYWMDWDLKWIERCDALLRLPGESPGADREVVHARSLAIPCYFSIDDLIKARDFRKDHV